MKYQWTKYLIMGLLGIAIEAFTGSDSLLAQQIPAISVEETPVIFVEDVEVLETPTGTPQDLGQIEGKNNTQWTWGVGGEPQTTSENPPTESIYQVNDKSQQNVTSADWQQDHENWQSINRGDFNPPSSKIPVAKF